MIDGPVDGLAFEILERVVWETARDTAAALPADRLHADPSDGEGEYLPCACGAAARRVGR